MKTMRVGRKIALGFGILLLLMLGGMFASNLGIHGVVRDARSVIDGNALRSVIAENEVDHLNWARKLEALLTDPAQRIFDPAQIQTDAHQCNLGKWIEDPQGRARAERLAPELASLFKELEAPHAQLHQSADEIGKVFRKPHTGLAQTLSNRFNDHTRWASTLSANLGAEVGGLLAYQKQTEEIVNAVYSQVARIAEDENLGDLPARQALAKEVLRSVRFGTGGNDYIFITDMRPYTVMHPIKPELEGQDMTETADPTGKRLFVEMVQVCQEKGQGFVFYQWPLPDSNISSPKISFVRLYKPWNWVIGTGIFLDPNDKALLARAADVAAGKPFSLGLETDPTQCAFGRFLADSQTAQLRREFPELGKSLAACEAPHARLHALARTIETHVNRRETEAALHVQQDEVLPTLAEIRQHFETALAAENTLQAGLEQAGVLYATQTQPALENVQDILNRIVEVSKEKTLTDTALLDSAQRTQKFLLVGGSISILLGLVLAFFIARSTTAPLKRAIAGMKIEAEKVAQDSVRIRQASLHLADGAVAQASRLEESASALEELSSQAHGNAEKTREATENAERARQATAEANQAMSQTVAAMENLKTSAGQVSGIIKTIEEIAFQTNLLALNAAVEAARAGEHGKGFAVVAEEVRNLAQRAATAARDTGHLIEGSVNQSNLGAARVLEAAESIGHIAEIIARVTAAIEEVNASSNEQSKAIAQINEAVMEMDKITQNVAGGAQEAATASEDLARQSQTMHNIVEQVAALVEETAPASSPATRLVQPAPAAARHEAVPRAGVRGTSASSAARPAALPMKGRKTSAPQSSSFPEIQPFDGDRSNFQDF